MSIYDQIGGSTAVTAAVDVFYNKVLGEPSLAANFADTDMIGAKLLPLEEQIVASESVV